MGLELLLLLFPFGYWCNCEASPSLQAWSRLEMDARVLIAVTFMKTRSMPIVVEIEAVEVYSSIRDVMSLFQEPSCKS